MRKPATTTTMMLRVGDLVLDDRFNRELDRAWVRRLVSDLDSRAVGALIVSERADGTRVIVDGQHRACAVKEKWGPNTLVACVVHRELTLQQEADLFFRLNQRRGLRAYDRFRAEVVARHPHAVGIVELLGERGLDYGRGTQSKTVAAIVSMEKAYHIGTLGGALSLLADSWGYARPTWDGHLIEGAALFLGRYPNADVDALRHKLASYRGGAEGFLGKAKQWKALHRTSTSRAVAALMVDTYNLRRKVTLPVWS